MSDIRDSLAQVQELSLDRDLDVLPPWPALPEPWTTASVTYAEDGETCTQKVWTKTQILAFGKACAQLALDEAARHGAGDADRSAELTTAWMAGAERERELAAWRTMDDVPPHDRKNESLGTEYLIWPPPSAGERTAFFGRRLGGKACWYKYGAPVHGVTHWRPLPAPPTDDAARAGERG